MTIIDILSPVLRRPLLCVALMWAGGIVLSAHLPVLWTTWFCAAFSMLVVWCVTAVRSASIAKISLGIAVLFLAAGMYAWQLRPITANDTRYLPTGGVVLVGYPLMPSGSTAYGWHSLFRVTRYRVGTTWRSVRSDVYLTGRGSVPVPGHYYELLAKVMSTERPGNPGEFDWQGYLIAHGLTYRMQQYEGRRLSQRAPTSPLGKVRARCSAALRCAMSGPYHALYAQVLEGLILGTYGSSLPEQLTEQFRRAGTLHIMVVSGSQITLLGGLLLIPMAFLPFGHARTSYPILRTILICCSLPFLGVYVAIADRGPSVDRALLMTLCVVISTMCALSPLGRQRSFRPDGVTLLAIAALVILISNPAMLFNPGMQLSFTAVFGLWCITPILLKLWRRWPRVVALPLAATLGAQIMTLPVLVWHFGTISLMAPWANFIAVPVVGILLPSGLLMLLLSLVSPSAGALLSWVNLPLLKILLWTNSVASSCKWGQVMCYVHSPIPIAIYFVMIVWGMLWLSHWLDSKGDGWDVPAGREPRMW